jgi:hypothetical protein
MIVLFLDQETNALNNSVELRVRALNVSDEYWNNFELLGEEKIETLYDILVRIGPQDIVFNSTVFKHFDGLGYYIVCMDNICENVTENYFWFVYEKIGSTEKQLEQGLITNNS